MQLNAITRIWTLDFISDIRFTSFRYHILPPPNLVTLIFIHSCSGSKFIISRYILWTPFKDNKAKVYMFRPGNELWAEDTDSAQLRQQPLKSRLGFLIRKVTRAECRVPQC